jgi:pyruvate,water dikinase
MSDKSDLLAAHEARGARAAEAEAEALRSLRPIARWRFGRLLANARAGARMRENLKSEGVRYLAGARRALLVLGAALSSRGVLDSADDIMFLEWGEVPRVRAGELDPRPLVARRRAEYRANRAVTPPPVVLGEWDGVGAAGGAGASAALDTLTGLGVASGIARGPARVIPSIFSPERVLPGEVLLAPVTDPGWTPHFLTASAIVVDMGGMLSHGSIIAREYGIPGVVNVGNGTSVIATGDIVEVDGSAGVVRVIERRAPAGS